MEWRFNKGLIKLPDGVRSQWPWSQLYYQIENFSMDLSMLLYDDAVDTLAMHRYVAHTAGDTRSDIPMTSAEQLLDKLKKGEIVDAQTGLPLLSGLDSSNLPLAEMDNLFAQQYERAKADQESQRRHGFRGANIT